MPIFSQAMVIAILARLAYACVAMILAIVIGLGIFAYVGSKLTDNLAIGALGTIASAAMGIVVFLVFDIVGYVFQYPARASVLASQQTQQADETGNSPGRSTSQNGVSKGDDSGQSTRSQWVLRVFALIALIALLGIGTCMIFGLDDPNDQMWNRAKTARWLLGIVLSMGAGIVLIVCAGALLIRKN